MLVASREKRITDMVRSVYARPPFFAKNIKTRQQVDEFNSRLRIAMFHSVEERETIAHKFAGTTLEKTQPLMDKVLRAVSTSPELHDHAQRAVRLAQNLRKHALEDAVSVREEIRRYIAGHDSLRMDIAHDINRVVGRLNLDWADAMEPFRAMYALNDYSGAKAIQAQASAKSITNLAEVLYVQSIASSSASTFNDADYYTVRTIFQQYPQLEDAIAARTNRINLKGFTDAMFEDIRDGFEQELYERAGGGLGAEALARDMENNLANALGTTDFIPEEKYMLWARTEGAVMQNDALMRLGTLGGLNGMQWISARDDRVRTQPNGGHKANDKQGIIPIGQKFADGSTDGGSGSVSPFMCILPDNKISANACAALKASYAGPAVSIKTFAGNTLTVTAQHPILTAKGFVPAGELHQGDYLLSDARSVKSTGVMGEDVHNTLPTIQQIFEAFVVTTPTLSVVKRIVNGFGMDLYGDERFIDGNIEIVSIQGSLLRNIVTTLAQRISKLCFKRTGVRSCALTTFGTFNKSTDGINGSTPSGMCGSGLLGTLFGSHFAPLEHFSFGTSAQFYSHALEVHRGISPLESMRIAGNLETHAVLVVTDEETQAFGADNARLHTAPYNNAVTFEQPGNGAVTHSVFLADAFQGTPGLVLHDKIIDVTHFDYSGDVYDLQTDTGIIIAGGVVVSNCRCVVGPALLAGTRPDISHVLLDK